MHIRERLLHDPQQRAREVGAEAVDLGGNIRGDGKAGTPAVSVDETHERLPQPITIEIGRVQQIAEGTDLLVGFLHQLLDLLELALRGGILGQVAAQRDQVEADGGELLRSRVVQLDRDALALESRRCDRSLMVSCAA
jgi:hypothetical protein